ncbi:MAG: GspH/FimT family pseudopilin [Candidatus Zipacnadales bacterium]
MSRRPQAAFTLLELMVVLMILVLLSALAAPSFRRQYHEAKLNSAARDIVALMQYARSQAIVEGTTYRLNIDRDAKRMWVTYYQPETDEQAGTPDNEPRFIVDESVLGATRELPDEITLRELQLGDEALSQLSEETLQELGTTHRLNEEGTPYIAFLPDGTTDGARLLIENEYEDRYVIALDAITGRTEVLEEY